MLTQNGVSPSVSTTEVWITLITFIVLYALLAGAAGFLMFRYARRALGDGGHGSAPPGGDGTDDHEAELVSALTY